MIGLNKIKGIRIKGFNEIESIRIRISIKLKILE